MISRKAYLGFWHNLRSDQRLSIMRNHMRKEEFELIEFEKYTKAFERASNIDLSRKIMRIVNDNNRQV